MVSSSWGLQRVGVVCVVGRKSGREGSEERGERKPGAVGETTYFQK
jgi:hypothetical protein